MMLDDMRLLYETARALRLERQRVLAERSRELAALVEVVRELRAEYIEACETEERAAMLLAHEPAKVAA
jgi:hypothetical protein